MGIERKEVVVLVGLSREERYSWALMAAVFESSSSPAD